MREIIADSRMMHIGKNGEGDALRVTFPVVAEWEALYGAGGVWTLNVQRNGDALAYAAQDFTIKDGAALWVVTDADAAVVGEGRCELTYKIGDTVAKSRTYSFRVNRSLTGGGDVPDPVKGWQEALEERVDGKLDRPDGGSAGDVLTKTGDGEEWQKPTGGKQLQADWNQNDRTAKDYIKNRPFYSQDETMVSSSYVDVLDSELNEMIEIPDNMNLIANIRWYKPFPFLEGSGKKMLYHIIIHISGQSSDIHNKASMSKKEDWSVIGGDNWKWDLGNTKNENFLLFFITDLSALDSAYTGMFPKTGIFLQRNNNWGYTYTKYTLNIGVTWLNMLDTNYIGSAIERTGNKVSEIVSGADAEQYPSVGAVEKYAVALQQAVSDAGKVLTVGEDGKVMPGSGGTDISLGLTSAQVGQIIKVKAVDENGKPTQWETANDGENWEKVADVTVTETVKVIRVTFDACSVVYVQLQYGGVEDDLGKIGIYPNQGETPYTNEKRSAAAVTETSNTNKHGYLFVTIDTRKGDKWTAASDTNNRGDGTFGEITPDALMNCEIGINNKRSFSLISNYYFSNRNESVENGVKSITAYGAGMAKGTTMRVWGIKK